MINMLHSRQIAELFRIASVTSFIEQYMDFIRMAYDRIRKWMHGTRDKRYIAKRRNEYAGNHAHR